MIARTARARSGITLTEILIAILIMGVGLISLATLFPLGLLRLREATRYSRAGLANETAADDMDTRVLFYKPSFSQTWYWTQVPNGPKIPRDPFIQDAAPNGSIVGVIASNPSSPNGINPLTGTSLLGTGLPICYDPLWRSITKVMPNVGLSDQTLDIQASYVSNVAPDEARFGAALLGANLTPYGVRPDPDGNSPSAHGLQRITNFIPWSGVAGSLNNQYPFTTMNWSLAATNQPADVAGNVFSSNDDVVFNAFTGNPALPSPLVPDMTSGVPAGQIGLPQADYRFTWFVTGHQVDAGGNGAQFAGEVVVCDGRPFGWDLAPGQSFNIPAGEQVVEAIYGYGKIAAGLNQGLGLGADRTVLLRWPTSVPDPQVRVGGWICDVTYERIPQIFGSRSTAGFTPFALTNGASSYARCYWYQVGKRSEPQADTLPVSASPVAYRSMVLTLTSPVRSKTLLNADGTPVHVNVALVMPSVINVFPRAFEAIPIYAP
jgi:type II secretory pathway pseudopilin PulG